VGDILELSYGKALKEADRDGGDVPVVGSGGVVGSHSTGITDSPTIVVGRKGSIGSVTWIDGPAWPIDTAYFVRPKLDELDRRWTYWMLRSLRMETMNKSAAVPGLNRDDVYRLNVSLPTFPEQRRIAAILDHVDGLRAKRRQVVTHLNSLTQSIYHDMFGDPILNAMDNPVSVLDDLIEDGRPITYGILKPGPDITDGVPYIRVADMKDGGIKIEGIRRTTPEISYQYRRSLLRAGDLLMSIRGHVGRFAHIPAALEGANITQDSARLSIASPALSSYVREAMTAPGLQRWMVRHTKGVAVRGLNIGDLRKVPIPVPPEAMVHEFHERITSAVATRERVRVGLQRADELVACLQSRAFRGGL
jgi:type I restriction enzyme S subunit